MAQKKFTQLPAASSLDGTEILAAVQGGSSARSTAQDVANRALTFLEVDTTPATFEFDFESTVNRVFNCTPSFGGGSKTINLSNFSNAKAFSFIMEISGGTSLGFTAIGSGFRMDDVRWSLGPDLWIEPGDGIFLGEAVYNGTDWLVKISGGPYVKT